VGGELPPATEGDAAAPPAPTEGDAAARPPDVTSGVAGSPREPGDAVVAALAAVPGIDSAQRLSDGRVLVATRLDARAVGALDGVRQVAESVSLPVAGATPSSLPTDPLVGHAWFLRNAAAPGVDTGGARGVAGEPWRGCDRRDRRHRVLAVAPGPRRVGVAEPRRAVRRRRHRRQRQGR
jgi:hypothetical protein